MLMPCKSLFFDIKSFEVVPQTTLEVALHVPRKLHFLRPKKKNTGQSVGPTHLTAILKMTHMSTRFAGCIAELLFSAKAKGRI